MAKKKAAERIKILDEQDLWVLNTFFKEALDILNAYPEMSADKNLLAKLTEDLIQYVKDRIATYTELANDNAKKVKTEKAAVEFMLFDCGPIRMYKTTLEHLLKIKDKVDTFLKENNYSYENKR